MKRVLVAIAILAIASMAGAATSVSSVESSLTGTNVASVVLSPGVDYTFTNSGKEIALLENNEATSATVTVVTTAQVSGFSVENLVVTIAASGAKIYGTFPSNVFNDTAGKIGFSSDTTLTLTLVKAKNN